MIYLYVDGVPPSVNHLYITTRGGGRALSPEGRKYKEGLRAHLAQMYGKELAKFEPNVPYLVLVRFHMNELLTKSWPKNAKNRYKGIDVTNRIKVLEDVIKEVAGVGFDDSQNHVVISQKIETADAEATEYWAWNLEKEATPFDAALSSTR